MFVRLAVDLGPEDDFEEAEDEIDSFPLDEYNDNNENNESNNNNNNSASPVHQMTPLGRGGGGGGRGGNTNLTTPTPIVSYEQSPSPFPSQHSHQLQRSPQSHCMVSNDGSGGGGTGGGGGGTGGGVSRSVSPLSSIGSVDLHERGEGDIINEGNRGGNTLSSPSHPPPSATAAGLPTFSSFMQSLADASAIVVNTVGLHIRFAQP